MHESACYLFVTVTGLGLWRLTPAGLEPAFAAEWMRYSVVLRLDVTLESSALLDALVLPLFGTTRSFIEILSYSFSTTIPAVSEFVTSKQVSITLQGRGAGSGEGSP